MNHVITCLAHWQSLSGLLGDFGLTLVPITDSEPIPGTHWGEPEAGLRGLMVYARNDTPVHSVLHEACHVICMDSGRRAHLNTDAKGDADEENGVCYLSVCLSEKIPGFGREQMFTDMDTWGYTFRLGSAKAWFEHDADDARTWLTEAGLLSSDGLPMSHLRA